MHVSTLQRQAHRGMPIRGSDKCGEELFASKDRKWDEVGTSAIFRTSCVSWSTYVEAIASVRRYATDVSQVIVTSEDIRYINLAKQHAARLRANGTDAHGRSPLKFVFNDADVSPGSGQLASRHIKTHPQYMQAIKQGMRRGAEPATNTQQARTRPPGFPL
jgi:hypothetical protein